MAVGLQLPDSAVSENSSYDTFLKWQTRRQLPRELWNTTVVFTAQADYSGFSSPHAAAQTSICMLVPRTELGLSETLMKLTWLLR